MSIRKTVKIRLDVVGAAQTKDVEYLPIGGTKLFVLTSGVHSGQSERWTLTHVPTGVRVIGGGNYYGYSMKYLRDVARKLSELSTASSTDTDVIRADRDRWVAIINECRKVSR